MIDAAGRVHPYTNAIAPAQPDTDAGHAPPSAGREPLPVALVAVTHFHPAAEWRPTRVTGAAAVVELVAHTPTVTTRPDEAIKAITKALDGAVVLKGERGEADAVAKQLLERLQA